MNAKSNVVNGSRIMALSATIVQVYPKRPPKNAIILLIVSVVLLHNQLKLMTLSASYYYSLWIYAANLQWLSI